jgi:hypothetical protein
MWQRSDISSLFKTSAPFSGVFYSTCHEGEGMLCGSALVAEFAFSRTFHYGGSYRVVPRCLYDSFMA